MHLNGPAIRAIRKDRGLILETLAAAAGISVGYLSRIERGQRGTAGVRQATAQGIADALSVPLEAILSTRGESAA